MHTEPVSKVFFLFLKIWTFGLHCFHLTSSITSLSMINNRQPKNQKQCLLQIPRTTKRTKPLLRRRATKRKTRLFSRAKSKVHQTVQPLRNNVHIYKARRLLFCAITLQLCIPLGCHYFQSHMSALRISNFDEPTQSRRPCSSSSVVN